MATAPNPIEPAPAVPDASKPEADFDTDYEAFMDWQKTVLTPGINALAANVYTNALNAAEQVTLAAEQVALAAEQATLATEQVALATEQVALAAEQATLATEQADLAASSANFAGNWASLSGAINKPKSVYHNGGFYALANNLENVALSEPGVTADWIAINSLPAYEYDSRGYLRSMASGNYAIVDGLGLFQYVAGSDEPDDDESCFATATGRWLLQAVHWDVVDSWQAPDNAMRDEYDEDESLRFASSFASKVLTGTAACSITSVASTASTNFVGTVTGAAVGDRAIATPPAELGATNAETGRLSFYAWVSAANTVTITLTNASASSVNTNAAIRAAWPITVIKS